MSRRKIIAGNWKMNMTPSEAVELVNTLKPLVVNDEVDVVFCVPAIDIIPVMEAAKGSNIQVGAENMYFEEKGAYTGEISPTLLVQDCVRRTGHDANLSLEGIPALDRRGLTAVFLYEIFHRKCERRHIFHLVLFDFHGHRLIDV